MHININIFYIEVFLLIRTVCTLAFYMQVLIKLNTFTVWNWFSKIKVCHISVFHLSKTKFQFIKYCFLVHDCFKEATKPFLECSVSMF